MTDRLAALCGAALLLISAGPLKAQTATAPLPVDVAANEMEILDAENKAIFRGAVDATRGTTNLKADQLTVTYADVKQKDGTTKTDATDLDARGNVTIKTPQETITGDWAKYNPQTEKLVVGGKVKLVQGATVLTGSELQADLRTDKIQMSGGRVRGSFLPQ
ncbi:LptA/OstA family protein [Aestuariivirga sp.]|uniref:LptA/OstA family protein n=1 Tax=Aestuariivirga sp. TaxID=2650926 RepID=UPI003918AC99